MTNISTAIEQGFQQLKTLIPEPLFESELLLCKVLDKNRAYLYAHPEQVLEPHQLEQYQNFLDKRAQGVPLAYITGTRDFWTLTLKVNAHTLIPRHETELIVELILKLIENKPDKHVLDLGTGSGAIALAIAKERPSWHIDACDSSKDALQVAKDNAKSNQINNVQFYQSNWFEQLPNQQYHAIVANPPYISPEDPHLKQGDVQFEPISALISSQEGMADLQCIVKQAPNWLLPAGLLLLEHGYEQKDPLTAILNRLGYIDVQCWQDLQGHDRVSGGWKPNK